MANAGALLHSPFVTPIGRYSRGGTLIVSYLQPRSMLKNPFCTLCTITNDFHYLFRPLGDLRFLRLWHNNAGKGDDGSWFCDFVALIDLQTKAKYTFLVEKWFAVDEEDGMVSNCRVEKFQKLLMEKRC